MAYAHEHGVIHRTSSPPTPRRGIREGRGHRLGPRQGPRRGGRREGILRGTRLPSIDPCITPAGKNYGTPMYMPPEIAGRDRPRRSGRRLLLGVILYEMLTDRFLVEGENAKDVIGKILHEPFPLPRETAPTKNLPRDLQAICMKAIRKDKRKRYPTVRALKTSGATATMRKSPFTGTPVGKSSTAGTTSTPSPPWPHSPPLSATSPTSSSEDEGEHLKTSPPSMKNRIRGPYAPLLRASSPPRIQLFSKSSKTGAPSILSAWHQPRVRRRQTILQTEQFSRAAARGDRSLWRGLLRGGRVGVEPGSCRSTW